MQPLRQWDELENYTYRVWSDFHITSPLKNSVHTAMSLSTGVIETPGVTCLLG